MFIIIECKIDSTADVALAQIKEKEYMLPWALDGREKVLIGVNFSTKKRRPDDWVIERGDGTIMRCSDHVSDHVSNHVSDHVKKLIMAIGKDTKTREDLMTLVSVNSRSYFRKKYMDPAIDAGYLVRLYPDSISRTDQAYYLTEKWIGTTGEVEKVINETCIT